MVALGLDHILTSLPSVDPSTTDSIMKKVGAFDQIMRGIKTAVRNNVRVSVNMVVTRETKNQVYEAGKLVAENGGQTLFVTRAVPPTYSQASNLSNYILSPIETKRALDDAIRVKNDFGIMIGSLVSYPLCFLEDLDKYEEMKPTPWDTFRKAMDNEKFDIVKKICLETKEGVFQHTKLKWVKVDYKDLENQIENNEVSIEEQLQIAKNVLQQLKEN